MQKIIIHVIVFFSWTPEDWKESLTSDWGVETSKEYKMLLDEFLSGYDSLDDSVLIPLLNENDSTQIYKVLSQANFSEEFLK